MSMSQETSEQLFAEIVALRLVLQRVNGRLATFHPDGFKAYMKEEIEAAHGDLRRMQINDTDPQRAINIRLKAEAVIDQMYGNMREGSPSE